MTILQHTGPCYTLGIASSTPIAEDRTWLSSPHPSFSAAHSKRLTHWFRCYWRVPWGNGPESTNLRSLHIFKAALCRFKSWPEHTDEPCELMCFSNKRWTPFLSRFLFKHLNSLHGGGWVLLQFHRRLDFSEFLFHFNWAQATPLLYFIIIIILIYYYYY